MSEYKINQEDESKKVVFEDDLRNSNSADSDNTPKMISWVIKYSGGLIKDEKQATYVIYVFIIIIFIITLFIIFGGSSPQNNINILPA